MMKRVFSTAAALRAAAPPAVAGMEGSGTAAVGAHPISSVRYDWAMTVLFCWFLIGVYIDGWAHNHEAVESFWTPYHLVLYSGFGAVASLTMAALGRNQARGYRFWDAAPAGYELSVIGIIIFTVGGLGDMVWHTLWGVETGIEPLLSPPHLLLMFGGMLIAPGPLRAYARRVAAHVQPAGWLAAAPSLLSWLFLLSALTFITNYLSNFGVTLAAKNFTERSGVAASDPALGISTCMIQAAIIAGTILVMLKAWRWSLPAGSLTIIIGLNIAMMALMKTHLVTTGRPVMILVGLAGGVAGDLLLRWLRPSARRQVQLRIFAFAFPALLYTFYFIAIATAGGGIAWTGPAWTGTIVLAGAIVQLVSFLVVIAPASQPVTASAATDGGATIEAGTSL